MTFLFKPVNGTITTENCLSPQNEPYIAKLSFSGFWNIFIEIDIKLMSKDYKVKKAKNSSERKNFQRVWKDLYLEERSWFDGNDFFCST